MYVLIVSRGYPSEKYKMNGIFEFDQAKALTSIGIKVIFAVVDLRSIRRRRRFGLESFIMDGVQVEAINIPCGKVPNKILYSIGELGLRILFSIIKRKYGKPFVVHAHFTQIGYIVTRLFRNNNIPIVVTEHSSLIHKKNIDSKLSKIAKFTYENSSKVIAVSNSLSYSISQQFNIQSEVIPNIVNTNLFTYKTPKYKNSYDITSTGSLIKSKGMDLLIEAFNKAFNKNLNIHLHIFGEGVERNRLERKISEYNLDKNVHLMGLQPRHIIAEKLQNSDCFVLASQSETFGVAYIEALAAGVPVVATKCGGPEDFINASNGILVEKDDLESLSNALFDIYTNKVKYNRKSISEETKKQFSQLTIAEKLKETYFQILEERDRS